MSGLDVDAFGPRRALLSGRHSGVGGLTSWASDLVQTALSSVGLMADMRASTSPAHGEWLSGPSD